MKTRCYSADCPAERAYPCARCGRLACAWHSEWDPDSTRMFRCHQCLASWRQQRRAALPWLLLFALVGLLLGTGTTIIVGRATSAGEGAVLGVLAGLVLWMVVAHRL